MISREVGLRCQNAYLRAPSTRYLTKVMLCEGRHFSQRSGTLLRAGLPKISSLEHTRRSPVALAFKAFFFLSFAFDFEKYIYMIDPERYFQ